MSEELPFEFERKFFVRKVPGEALKHGAAQTIVQAYVFAQAGYAVRVRIAFPGPYTSLPRYDERVDHMGGYERRVLALLLDRAQETPHTDGQDGEENGAQATITVKSPSVRGERYELETPLDFDVAVQIIQHSAHLIVKQRYSLWIGEDGWEFDVFAGQNQGLAVAECERMGPVTDLRIPDFCVTEVTDDVRFTNDRLAREPWSQWDTQFYAQLSACGPYFEK